MEQYLGDYLVYLRKSQTDRDFAELSVEETLKRHEDRLNEFIKQNKINVPLPPFKEVVSGELLSSRPQMLKVLELVGTGKYAGVICMDIDRLSRGSSLDSGYIMQVLQINNCKIVTPNKTYDLNNDLDEQFGEMKFMFARMELKTINKRLNAGRDKSASEGKFCGGTVPYGYEKYKLQGTKGYSLKIVPDEAKIVQMIFDMYTEERIGFGSIAYRLNDLHIPSRYGKKWVSPSVRKVLTNDAYRGKIHWKKYTADKKVVNGSFVKKRTRKKDYELHDGLHEAIISEEQFALAKKIMEERYVPPTKQGNSLRNPFAGLMFCAKCGQRIKLEGSGNRNKQDRYKCIDQGVPCTCKSSTRYEVENAILTKMRNWLEGYVLSIEHIKPTSDNSLTTALDILQKELSALTAQQDNICNLLEQGVYTVQMFTKRNTALQADIDRITEGIKDLEQQIAEQNKEQTVVENIIPAAQKLLDNYEDLTAKEKNELWKSVLYKIEYEKEESRGEFKIKIYPKLGQTQ